MSTDDPRPARLTAEHIAEDLSLSNEEGTSWFGYQIGDDPETLRVELYDDEGAIEKTFTVRLTIEEN